MSGSVNSLWMFRAEGAVMNLLVWLAMSWNYTTNSSKKFWAPRRLVTLSVCLSLQCKCLQDCVDISLWEQRAACTHSCSFIRDVERLGKASFQNNLSYCFSNYSREVNLRTPALSLCLSVTAAKPVIRSRRLDSGDSRAAISSLSTSTPANSLTWRCGFLISKSKGSLHCRMFMAYLYTVHAR